MIGTFFKLVGKAVRMAVHRPIQRFNIFNRVKKYLGEDAKYFMPAPRAIGSQSLQSSKAPLQYPHLQGRGSGFKSIKQRRLDAITERNHKLLSQADSVAHTTAPQVQPDAGKSFSETINDDNLVISTSSKLPVIKTVTVRDRPKRAYEEEIEEEQPPQQASEGCQKSPDGQLVAQDKPKRPLPTSTSLQLSDPAVIWQVDKVPPGRLDLSKLQELLINKLADDAYWTPKKIAETYNIKEEYAENLITYFKQIRIIISPKMAKALDYVARTDPIYQATKHIIYQVDKSLRSEFDKQFDKMFLPTDELDAEVRELLETDKSMEPYQPAHSRLANLIRRPVPLRLEQPTNTESAQIEATLEATDVPKLSKPVKRLATPLNVRRPLADSKDAVGSREKAAHDTAG